MPLNTQAHGAPRADFYDDFYEALITAHQGLSTEESHAMNARLLLLLANHIGDLPVLREALRLARGQDAGRECAGDAGLGRDASCTPQRPSGG